MDNQSKYFQYPVTCCNNGNGFTEDWNNLPIDKFSSVAYCAINGTGINDIVSLFCHIRTNRILNLFKGML